MENNNFLILDEPTNHLDIDSKEVLENALIDFDGTLLFVSHDRYFINKTATRIIELFSNRFDNYIGNYDYYIEKKEDVRAYGDSLQKDKMPLEAIDCRRSLKIGRKGEQEARLGKPERALRKEKKVAECLAKGGGKKLPSWKSEKKSSLPPWKKSDPMSGASWKSIESRKQ